MLRHAKKILTTLRVVYCWFYAIPARLNRYDATLNRLDQRLETLYQLALLDRMRPALSGAILRLPEAFTHHLASTDPDVLERNADSVLALRRAKTDLLLDIAEAAKLLPMTQREALFREALVQADPYSRELAAWKLSRLLFMHGLDDAPLLRLLDETLAVAGRDDALPERRNMQAMRIALLTIRGDTATALSLLERHLSAHGRAALYIFPPAAWLAHTHGESGPSLSAPALVYENIRQNREEASFQAFLHGKSIALVGNGPQELGRGRGGAIDAHDVVVRVNHPVVGGKYSADYGTKTTIWCLNGLKPHSKSGFPAVRRLLLPNNCERCLVSWAQSRALAGSIRKQGRGIIAPSRAEMQNLIRDLGVDYCSTGLLAAALLRRLAPAFSADDVYGMSCAENGADSYRAMPRLYYFDEMPAAADAYEVHALDLERAAFARLFA